MRQVYQRNSKKNLIKKGKLKIGQICPVFFIGLRVLQSVTSCVVYNGNA
jgi:hypothetical protein